MAGRKKEQVFTDEEQEAMKERAREVKRGKKAAADEEPEVLAKIAELAPADRAMAERLHALVRARAPSLAPKLWYGMPAYALGGKTLCFLQPAARFKTRYATLGFSDAAALDDGPMWATSFALLEWTPATEARVAALLEQAAARASA